MSDYLICANDVFADLNSFYDSFADEAELINSVKCLLINGESLNEIYLSNGVAMAYMDGDNYYLSYNGLNLYLEQADGIIIDYRVLS